MLELNLVTDGLPIDAVQILLGSLREVEVELLTDNLKYAITETVLAVTMFQHDFR